MYMDTSGLNLNYIAANHSNEIIGSPGMILNLREDLSDPCNGNNGICSQCPSLTAGKFGDALDFKGAEYVEIPHDDDFSINEGTVSLWFKTRSIGWQGLFSKHALNLGSGGHLTLDIIETSELRARLQSTFASHEIFFPITIDKWYHAAVTFGPDLRLYINGVLVGTEQYSGGISGNSEPIVIGASTSFSDDLSLLPLTRYFDGIIDEVYVWNRAFNAAEITDLYKKGEISRSCFKVSCQGMILNLREDTNDTCNRNNGICSQCPVREAGKFGEAMDFREGEFIEIPHGDDFNIDEGTVSLWFKTRSIGWQGIFSKDALNFGTGGHLTLDILEISELRARLQSTKASHEIFSPITTDKWYHAAVTFGPEFRLYINGVLVGTEQYSGGISGNSEPIVIGASTSLSDDLSVSPLTRYFDGLIDEVYVWNRALDADEVTELYKNGEICSACFMADER